MHVASRALNFFGQILGVWMSQDKSKIRQKFQPNIL